MVIMAQTVLVTGGTGTLGKLVTPLLREAGVSVRVLSRTAREARDGIEYVAGDLQTGVGVGAAVAGVDTVLHLAGTNKGDGQKAQALVDGIQAAGVFPHLVFISVVGAERVPVESAIDRQTMAYMASKRDAELVVENSGLPWTTLRATQFHDLLFTMVSALGRMPVVPVVDFRFQPIEAAEVAARLVELTLGEPAGYVAEIGGPKIYTMKELERSYLAATGRRRPVFTMKAPGKASRAYAAGGNLTPDHAVGERTWEEFLAAKLATA
ncbi:NmrA family transcriptional regulator [Nocardia seriolae]|uniref:NmrA family transcriptional regulator n=2 Tax=Nocardia seriolae TaxID=37332 RepID=A0ABC9YT00_9NOCA|nr:NmrA family transcriptional regulator [Nocardia seriolae]GEM26054.1 NmrA family transcriptional regulator [Nocardia seriolae NBRC 15557]BEK87883.1 NAD(P)H-binding protein [Nocardia seriolae]BEK96632.1 NAD(P)H-binding protein [Nocardia seriolae]GAM46661.1 NmrA family transcriptional regulator [Nocardia seriolae]